MKNFKRSLLLIAAALCFVFLNTFSVGYAFFDEKSSTQSAMIGIGNWTLPGQPVSFSTGFESFTNSNTGTVTQMIDNMSFDLTNVVAGTLSSDRKNGTTSARINNVGSITTTDYYKGYQTISFNLGMSTAGATNGNYLYNIQISNNGTSWTNVFNQSKPFATLTPYSYNLQTLLANGITLADNSVANAETYLKLRILFTGGNQNGSRIFNLDDLTIVYTP